MQKISTLEKKYTIINNLIYTSTGNTVKDYDPLFDFIEEYCKKNNALAKWENDTLFLYTKDFNVLKSNQDKAKIPFIIASISTEQTSKGYNDEYGFVRFNESFDPIIHISDMIEIIKAIVNSKQPIECYYTPEELVAKHNEKISNEKDKQIELFNETLKDLNINEQDFLYLKKIYDKI